VKAMKILDKYLSKNFLIVLISSNILSSLLFLLVSVLDQLSNLLVKRQLTLGQIFIYFSFQLPQIAYYCAPLSVLFALLLTMGILGQRQELTIMRGSGLSWWQIMRFPLFLTVVYAWLMYLLGGWMIPYSNQKTRAFELLEIKKEVSAGPIADLWIFNSKDPKNQYAIYIPVYLPSKNTVKKMAIYQLDNDFFPFQEIQAKSAKYVEHSDWILKNVKVFHYQRDAQPVLEKFKKMPIKLPIKPKDFYTFKKWPDELTLPELSSYLGKLKRFGLDPREYKVELNARYSLPFACLILFGLGLGISIRMRRPQGIYLNLAYAIAGSFGYFAIMAQCLSLGKSGKLPPSLSAWIANVVFGLISLYLLVSRERS